MAYGKVNDAFWESGRIDTLSDRGALLALFLISGPHRNAIGCFRLGKGAILDHPRFEKWGIEGVSDTLSELARTGFIVRDDRTGWTFIVNALKHDPIKGAKAAIHALGLLTRVPTQSIVYKELYDKIRPQLKMEDKALQGKTGYPIEPPCDTPSEGDAIPKPSPNLTLTYPNLSPSSAKKPMETPEGFEAFWTAYPRKVSKPDALKAYAKAIKRDAPEAILAGVKAYRFSPEAEFQPHAATWLNGDRWKDGKAPAAGSTPQELSDAEKLRRVSNYVAHYHRCGEWHGEGPRPGYPGCTVPADILTKYGYPATQAEGP